MENPTRQGDIVIVKTGRDKGKYFLVIETENGVAYIVNGKDRKVQNPKKKNIKHIKKVLTESLKDLAEKIQSGQPTANTKIYLAIRTETQKLQED